MNWPCLLGHSTWHRGRDKDGKPCRLCDRCLEPMGVLLSSTVERKPLEQHVAGQPTGRAVKERKNVVAFERTSER